MATETDVSLLDAAVAGLLGSQDTTANAPASAMGMESSGASAPEAAIMPDTVTQSLHSTDKVAEATVALAPHVVSQDAQHMAGAAVPSRGPSQHTAPQVDLSQVWARPEAPLLEERDSAVDVVLAEGGFLPVPGEE